MQREMYGEIEVYVRWEIVESVSPRKKRRGGDRSSVLGLIFMMHDRRSRFETLEIFFNAHWERTNAAVG